MLVSILMTARNADRYIDECIQSIIDQDDARWELCVVDNLSTDLTLKKIQHYAAHDSRIRLIPAKNGEIITALREAYEHSNGELITRMDADDVMPPNRIGVMRALCTEGGLGTVATGAVKYISDEGLGEGFLRYEKWLNELMKQGTHYDELYKECVIPSPCWMIHREDFEKCDAYQPDRYPEDYDLCFRFYREGLAIRSTEQIMLYWRDYAIRNSRTDEKYQDNSFTGLKWYWFQKLSLDNTRPLVIWGAGKKAKNLVKLIHQPLTWCSSNHNKIGCNIYGHILVDLPRVFDMDRPQIIVAFSSPQELADSEKICRNQGWVKNKDIFYFF